MGYTSDAEHEERLARLCKNPPKPVPQPEIVPVATVFAEAEDAACKEIDEARKIGYASRLLVQVTLPHSKPPLGQQEYERSNGCLTLKITADSAYGLPYGTYPRLIMAWLTTEAVRRKSPEMELGDSLRQFMARLGIDPGGGPRGSAPRLREHMQRLFTSTMSATVRRNGEWQRLGFCPVEQCSIFWHPTDSKQVTSWRSTVRLNHAFYSELVEHPVPVDLNVLQVLGLGNEGSPMRLDLYQWLTHRLSYVKEPVSVPWEGLQKQFGGDYGRLCDFRKKFIKHLKAVLKHYPNAKVEITSGGLLLRPSKTHIPMRLVRGGKR